MNYIVYAVRRMSLLAIIVIIYLIPSDTEIIPVQTPLEQKIAFFQECISENINSKELNGDTPNQLCTNMYKIQD